MSLSRLLRVALSVSPLVPLVFLPGCNGGDSGPSDSPVTIEKSSKSGDAQVGIVGQALPTPLEVLILRDGLPAQNVEVEWAAGNDGSVSPSTSESDEDGLATTIWTLGPEAGTQNASARVTGVAGTVSFTATAEDEDPPNGATVTVSDNNFTPRNVTILVNQTVTWVWGTTANAHNVSPSDGVTPPRSGDLTAGPNTYSYTFGAPGTYTYYCEAHGLPAGTGMAGTVTVLAEAP
jgi:plastocyanin